jgi:tripartite-type tricarboxylate transporter receptor subunit TctC
MNSVSIRNSVSVGNRKKVVGHGARSQRRNGRGIRHGRCFALFGGVIVAGLLLPTASYGAQAQKTSQSPLKRGLAYFQGKTITNIEPGSVGGNFDEWALLVSPLMGQYLHASVNVEPMTTGGTFPGQDATAAATPNGLTFGQLNPLADISSILTNTPTINFNPERLDFLGGPPGVPQVWVTSPSSSYKNFRAVQTAANVSVLNVASGTSNFEVRAISGVFGIHASFISGFENSAEEEEGFLSGDGPVSALPETNYAASIEGGQARLVFLTNSTQSAAALKPYLKGVPTLTTYAKKYPPKTAKQRRALASLEYMVNLSSDLFVVPTKTPADEVDALRAALKFALENPGVKAQAIAEGLAPGYINGTQSKAQFIAGVKKGSALTSYIEG